MLIDTHCHLDALEFEEDREEALRRARNAGVGAFVIPAVDRNSFSRVIGLCDAHPDCFAALGIHPLYVGAAARQDIVFLENLIGKKRPLAIGEIGLDFFVPGFDRDEQSSYFEAQLNMAKRHDLPVLLHVRRAQDAVLSLLRKARVKGGIAHAFNGSLQQANEFIKLGFKLGFGGAMTYDRALKIRKLAQEVPLSAIVLETDSPDMAPSFARGRNSPENLPEIAQCLAQLRGVPVRKIEEDTTRNAMEILEMPS